VSPLILTSSCRSVVIEYLRHHCRNINRSTAVVFIYCNHKIKLSVTDILASLLKQLLVSSAGLIPGSIDSLYSKHRSRNTFPSRQELQEELKSLINGYSQVFVVIDALDEYPEQDRTLLINSAILPLHCNLLVTSRDLALIQQQFRDMPRLDIAASPADLAKYVEDRIDNEPRLQKLVKDTSQRQELVKIVVAKATSM
jgi:hypothetical protein